MCRVEISAYIDILDRDGALPASAPELRARENLVQVLLNHHEFVTIR